MSGIDEMSFEECKSWLNDNQPDPETDDVFDRAYYKEVKNRYYKLLKKKIYIKVKQQLPLPNERYGVI